MNSNARRSRNRRGKPISGSRGRLRRLRGASHLSRFKATAWIDGVAGAAKRGKPFFLYLPLTSPHKPVCPQKRFRGKSKAGLYGDFMMETDFRVGQLLACLDKHDLAKNTIVIFTADNGAENTYRDRIQRYDHSSNAPYRGGKRDLYEGGHRVPFIVRWPRHVKAGSQSKTTVCQTDLLATFADLLDTELPANAGEDSFSLLKTLRGDTDATPPRAPIVHHSVAGGFAIRDGDWKLILGRGPQGKAKAPQGEPEYELYNLKLDPAESRNVIAANEALALRLKSAITKLVNNGRSNEGPKQTNFGGWWPRLTWIEKPTAAPGKSRTGKRR